MLGRSGKNAYKTAQRITDAETDAHQEQIANDPVPPFAPSHLSGQIHSAVSFLLDLLS